MNKLIIIPCILSGIRSRKDKSFAITFDTQELNPEQSYNSLSMLNEYGYLAFKNEPFREEEKELLESIKANSIEFNQKNPSQRLRAVLYRLWEQNNEGYSDYNLYYEFKMNALIEHFKGKLL